MKALNEERVTTLKIGVDYSLSLRAMIQRGCFERVNANITGRNFKLTRRGYVELEIVLVQFGSPISPLEVTMQMKEHGCRPAVLEELLAVGSHHPDLQRAMPIVALGSGRMEQNRRYVPCLGGSRSARALNLVVVYRRWSKYFRFAFVKGD